ncbi:MAG: hypothetical protein HBSIN02_25400 [Bacteroidia bacterium]|nr:MAG: hypothetical protein HBSIN02_25400 [Bacteroidia bacterium]
MKHFMVVIAMGSLIACQQSQEYELTTHGGSTYRLERRSGQISIVEGTKIIPLEEHSTDLANDAATKLRETKTWPQIDLPQLDSLKLNLRTRWREGYVHFIFTVTPYNSRIRRAHQEYLGSNNFKLKLLDSGGFVIIEKQINLTDMTRTVDDKDKAIGLQINAKLPCSAETYLDIEHWTCGWQI